MFEIFKNILTLMSCTFHITSDIVESLAFRKIGGLVIEKRIQRDLKNKIPLSTHPKDLPLYKS